MRSRRRARSSGIALRLRQVPGVTSVGLSSSITMDGEDNGNRIDVEGVPVPDGTLPPLRRFKSVGPGYFETMGNRLVAGRSITWTEIYAAPALHVISADPGARVLAGAREGARQAGARAIGRRTRGGKSSAWSATSATTG